MCGTWGRNTVAASSWPWSARSTHSRVQKPAPTPAANAAPSEVVSRLGGRSTGSCAAAAGVWQTEQARPLAGPCMHAARVGPKAALTN